MKIKIGSLNVHKLEPYEDRCNDIVQLIKDNQIDIMCFQEMTRAGLQKLNEDIKWNDMFWFGNAILTKLKILNSTNISLPKFRGGLKLTLINENNEKIIVMLTHLDHLHEDNRISQLRELNPYLQNVDFLIGDFNSLNPEDYSKNGYEKINKQRLAARLERARNEVIDMIKSFDFNINPFISPTCPYGTRVDYIFYKRSFMGRYKIKEKIDEVIDTTISDISDHNLITAKME